MYTTPPNKNQHNPISKLKTKNPKFKFTKILNIFCQNQSTTFQSNVSRSFNRFNIKVTTLITTTVLESCILQGINYTYSNLDVNIYSTNIVYHSVHSVGHQLYLLSLGCKYIYATILVCHSLLSETSDLPLHP